MRVIIAGGRDFSDYDLLKSKCDYYLSNILEDICIISGGADGADYLGELYAKELGYDLITYHANWTKHGRAAGPIRNVAMAKNADLLIAFWDGKSKGTDHMITTAKMFNLKIRVINYESIL